MASVMGGRKSQPCFRAVEKNPQTRSNICAPLGMRNEPRRYLKAACTEAAPGSHAQIANFPREEPPLPRSPSFSKTGVIEKLLTERKPIRALRKSTRSLEPMNNETKRGRVVELWAK